MKLLFAAALIGAPIALAENEPSEAVQEQAATDEAPQDHAARMAEVARGEEDPLSVPVTNGIVWYGTWEDAMAEKERTGKPVMLHFGSPRCPEKGVSVPGSW